MGLGKNISRYKALLEQGSDLFMLRLRILMIDLSAQAGSAVRVFAAIVFAAVLLLVALISVLFGLNTVLTPEWKVKVFFGVAIGAIILVAILLLWALAGWKNRSGRVMQTLADMQQDLACLRGQQSEQAESQNQIEQANVSPSQKELKHD